jgi:hypothetical protein
VLFSILAHEVAFLDQPLHFTVQLLEDLVYKGYTGEYTRGLGEQTGGCGCGAYDETAIVEGWCVFGEPGGDDAGPGGWQQVCWVAVGGGSGGDGHDWMGVVRLGL